MNALAVLGGAVAVFVSIQRQLLNNLMQVKLRQEAAQIGHYLLTFTDCQLTQSEPSWSSACAAGGNVKLVAPDKSEILPAAGKIFEKMKVTASCQAGLITLHSTSMDSSGYSKKLLGGVPIVCSELNAVPKVFITPARADIVVDANASYKGFLMDQAGTVLDVTSKGIWAADVPAVAAPKSPGVFRGLAKGQTGIRFVYQGAAARADLYVYKAVTVQRVGVNFEDLPYWTDKRVIDFNDAVLCFTGAFIVDGTPIISQGDQNVIGRITSNSTCDHKIQIDVANPDGSKWTSGIFFTAGDPKNPGNHQHPSQINMPFLEGSTLSVGFYPLGHCEDLMKDWLDKIVGGWVTMDNKNWAIVKPTFAIPAENDASNKSEFPKREEKKVGCENGKLNLAAKVPQRYPSVFQQRSTHYI